MALREAISGTADLHVALREAISESPELVRGASPRVFDQPTRSKSLREAFPGVAIPYVVLREAISGTPNPHVPLPEAFRAHPLRHAPLPPADRAHGLGRIPSRKRFRRNQAPATRFAKRPRASRPRRGYRRSRLEYAISSKKARPLSCEELSFDLIVGKSGPRVDDAPTPTLDTAAPGAPPPKSGAGPLLHREREISRLAGSPSPEAGEGAGGWGPSGKSASKSR